MHSYQLHYTETKRVISESRNTATAVTAAPPLKSRETTRMKSAMSDEVMTLDPICASCRFVYPMRDTKLIRVYEILNLCFSYLTTECVLRKTKAH